MELRLDGRILAGTDGDDDRQCPSLASSSYEVSTSHTSDTSTHTGKKARYSCVFRQSDTYPLGLNHHIKGLYMCLCSTYYHSIWRYETFTKA